MKNKNFCKSFVFLNINFVNINIMSVIETQRTGKIVEFYDEGTGMEYDFAHPGAKVLFIRDETVLFLTITTPSGRVIVKKIEKTF